MVGQHTINKSVLELAAAQTDAAEHSVHPTGGSLRVFRHFVWLEVGSVKAALSRPAHQRVTPAVETVEKVGESSTKLQGSVR